MNRQANGLTDQCMKQQYVAIAIRFGNNEDGLLVETSISHTTPLKHMPAKLRKIIKKFLQV